MPTIVVEGFDNTGKTTLAKQLAKLLEFDYVSGGGPEVGTFNGALDRLKLHAPKKVQDRTWISEMVYGPICRDQHLLSKVQILDLMKYHLDNRVHLIYAKRTYEQVMATINERGQMDGVERHAKELLAAYDYWMLGKLPIYLGNPIIYDFEKITPMAIIEKLAYLGALTGTDVVRARNNYGRRI